MTCRWFWVFALGLWAGAAHGFTDGHIFITNRGGNNVLEVDEQLVLVRAWFDLEGLSVPNGMAVTPSGRLYVADTGNQRIVVFDSGGSKLNEWSTQAAMGGSVEALNFSAGGTLYASANPGVGRVARFAMDGTPMGYLVDDASFLNLGNVNLTGNKTVIVSDFSATGRGMRELDPATGVVVNTFAIEAGLLQEDALVDGGDRIFISHYNRDLVMVFNKNRQFERTLTATGLKRPTGLVLTKDCRLIVASFDSDELYEFKHDGTFLRKVTIAGMSRPESLVIIGQGLPGSFAEFVDTVPSCDPIPDGGSADLSPSADLALGPGGPPLRNPEGCGCRVGGGPDANSWTLLLLSLPLARLVRRRWGRI